MYRGRESLKWCSVALQCEEVEIEWARGLLVTAMENLTEEVAEIDGEVL